MESEAKNKTFDTLPAFGSLTVIAIFHQKSFILIQTLWVTGLNRGKNFSEGARRIPFSPTQVCGRGLSPR